MIRSTARLYSFRRSISVSPLVTFDHRSSDSENNKLHANNLPIIAVLPRYRYSAPLKQQFRNYSATTALFNEDDSVDAVMDKLFEDSKLLDDADQLVALQAETAAANAAETAFVFEPVWYNAPDQVIRVMTYAHDTLGLDWTATILCGTLILRLGLVPFTITQRRASSRLMHMRPEMEMIQSQIQQQRELGMTMAEQKAVRERMHALYKRYDVKTSRIFISPLVSIPTMISFFFGIRKLDMIYPEQMSVEGWWWFTDLTACDSTYVLPLVSALFFMINVELGKGELQTAQGAMKHMLPFLRFMGLTIFPVSCYFPSALLIYWIPSGALLCLQTFLLKQKSIRDMFGIWDMPKPPPGQGNKGVLENLNNLKKKFSGEPVSDEDKIKRHNAELEVKKRAKAFQLKRARRNKL